jgi:hypothetical protein
MELIGEEVEESAYETNVHDSEEVDVEEEHEIDMQQLRRGVVHVLQQNRVQRQVEENDRDRVERIRDEGNKSSREKVTAAKRKKRLEVPVCRCNGRCFSKFTVDEMTAMRIKLKELDYGERQLFLSSMITVMRVVRQRRTARERRQIRRRKFSVEYHLKVPEKGVVEVCKDFFLKFLQVGGCTMSKITNQVGTVGVPVVEDGRGKHGRHKTKEGEVVEDFEVFIGMLPKFRVKYKLRADPGRQYLSAMWTVRRLVSKFNEQRVAAGKEAVGRKLFKNLMNRYFPNLTIGVPKTDCCTRCMTLDDRARTSETEEARQSAERMKEEHLEIAEDRRKQYNMDVKKAKGIYVEEQQNRTVDEEYVDVGSEEEGNKLFS